MTTGGEKSWGQEVQAENALKAEVEPEEQGKRREPASGNQQR